MWFVVKNMAIEEIIQQVTDIYKNSGEEHLSLFGACIKEKNPEINLSLVARFKCLIYHLIYHGK